jgi:hypothetical protein
MRFKIIYVCLQNLSVDLSIMIQFILPKWCRKHVILHQFYVTNVNNRTALDDEIKQTCGYIFSFLYHVKYLLLADRKHKLMRMTLLLFMITTIQRC